MSEPAGAAEFGIDQGEQAVEISVDQRRRGERGRIELGQSGIRQGHGRKAVLTRRAGRAHLRILIPGDGERGRARAGAQVPTGFHDGSFRGRKFGRRTSRSRGMDWSKVRAKFKASADKRSRVSSGPLLSPVPLTLDPLLLAKPPADCSDGSAGSKPGNGAVWHLTVGDVERQIRRVHVRQIDRLPLVVAPGFRKGQIRAVVPFVRISTRR